jgi:hypothetical protein
MTYYDQGGPIPLFHRAEAINNCAWRAWTIHVIMIIDAMVMVKMRAVLSGTHSAPRDGRPGRAR